MTRTKAVAWVGGASYLLVVGLLVWGAPRAPGTVHAAGSLLAVSLLVGMVRRMPLSALAMTLIGSTAVVVGPPGSAYESLAASYQGQFLSYLAVDLVLGFVVATRARRASIVAVAVSFTVQLLVIGGFAHGDDLTVNGVIALLAIVASCMAGLLTRERREHAAALRSQEVTAERLRIARELHDMVAHSIGIIAIQAGVGSRVIETQPAEAGEALRTIEAASRQTLSSLRRTLVALRQADGGAIGSERSPLAPLAGPGERRTIGGGDRGRGGTRRRAPQWGATSFAGRHRSGRLPHRAGGVDQRGPPRGHRLLPGGHRLRRRGTVR
ncbi:sensor histidine kinase [Microbispora rosea]|uniref:sensor histidine kinase n=1 Tax=Microbispora rosea TaxID=58117 RepID=UPI00341E884A